MFKKLASQHFSQKNGNESIMVTNAFLARFLSEKFGAFGFWTFLKMSIFENLWPNADFSFFLILGFFGILGFLNILSFNNIYV